VSLVVSAPQVKEDRCVEFYGEFVEERRMRFVRYRRDDRELIREEVTGLAARMLLLEASL